MQDIMSSVLSKIQNGKPVGLRQGVVVQGNTWNYRWLRGHTPTAMQHAFINAYARKVKHEK